MNTDFLRYLLIANDYHSINQAAEALHLQRSYLSKVITTLEKQLSTTIFQRDNKGIVPTPEGAALLERVKTVVDALDELEKYAALKNTNAYHDELTILFPGYARRHTKALKSISEFQKKFPNVSIHLIGENNRYIYQYVTDNPSYLAFVFHSALTVHFNSTLSKDLDFLPLEEKPLVAIVSKNNPFAKKYKSISLRLLVKQPLALLNQNLSKDFFIYKLLSQYGEPMVKYITNDINLLNQYLDETNTFSLGLALPEIDENLLQIPIRDNIIIQFGILYNRSNQNKFLHEHFLNIVQDTYNFI